jgi:hypothetical protein
MDKAFWQSITDNEYAIPPDSSVQALTSELLSYLGSVDPELREGPAYTILDAWIHRDYYSHTELWKMATQLLQHLTIGLGKQQSDTIFWRSFSLLILTEIVHHDLTHPTLSETEVWQVLSRHWPISKPRKTWVAMMLRRDGCTLMLMRRIFCRF